MYTLYKDRHVVDLPVVVPVRVEDTVKLVPSALLFCLRCCDCLVATCASFVLR